MFKSCNELHQKIFSKVVETDSTEGSEIIKLTSNAYRDLNFAFANEISRIANSYNLSGLILLEKPTGYPRNNIDKPSLGVGGFCLPKMFFLKTLWIKTRLQLINFKRNKSKKC